ncbi:MAG: hypothetical protein ABIA78_03940 [archaeon]
MMYDLIYRQNPKLFDILNGCPNGNCFHKEVIQEGRKMRGIEIGTSKWYNICFGSGSPKQRVTNISLENHSKRKRERKHIKDVFIPRRIRTVQASKTGIEFRKYSSLFR